MGIPISSCAQKSRGSSKLTRSERIKPLGSAHPSLKQSLGAVSPANFCPQQSRLIFCTATAAKTVQDSSTAMSLIQIVAISTYKIRMVFEGDLFQEGKQSKGGENV